jgi:hypothetical protein
VLVLDMIEILPPLGKYKYDTYRILNMKCYIDNSMRLWSCIRNVNNRYGFDKKSARTHCAKLVFLHPVGSVGQ